MLYQLLNIIFFVFHTGFTLFNLVGWAFPNTRKVHLMTLFFTAFSWFVLGIWYGWGYCVCTDWHWEVREKLGYEDRSASYIHFLILKISGLDLDTKLVETATLVIFLGCVVLSLWYNVKSWKQKRPGV